MAHGHKFAKLKSANNQNLAHPNLPAIRTVHCKSILYITLMYILYCSTSGRSSYLVCVSFMLLFKRGGSLGHWVGIYLTNSMRLI